MAKENHDSLGVEAPDLHSVQPNAWIVRINNSQSLAYFSITLDMDSSECAGIRPGDGFLLIEETMRIFAIARVYRKRPGHSCTTFLFDGITAVEPVKSLTDFGVSQSQNASFISRLDWAVFESVTQQICGFQFSALPVVSGDTPQEQAYVRELLQSAVVDDLLGPAGGPTEEIIDMSVRDRYLVGKLAPQNTRIEDEDNIAKAGEIDSEESEGEVDASTNQSLVPSSIGFTFCVDGSVSEVELDARWGRYQRGESERINEKTEKPFRAWKRIPSGGTKTITLKQGIIEPFVIDETCPEVIIQGTVSNPLESGDRLVTLFMVNTQDAPKQNQDAAWVFQPAMKVRDLHGQAIFRKRPVLGMNGADEERESLEMIYRNHVEFAVGHGVSVHAVIAEHDNEHAIEVRTSVIPTFEVPVTETPGLDVSDRPAMRRLVNEGYLDMERLAQLEVDELINALTILTEDYKNWITEQRSRIGSSVHGYESPANEALNRCEIVLGRLKDGINTLRTNEKAVEAFRFANRAMASQRIHSIFALQRRRGEAPDLDALNVSKNRSWRPFQLAFMLLSIPSLADPTHKDRTEPLEAYADLLWFPTGGGKTEAYLGVAAFTMAIRRLQHDLGDFDSGRGLAVIMRYTLRLLTLQQFQRATALICAMEVLRRGNPQVWGQEPFTIGLWVGQRVTPNTTKESHDAIEAEREKKHRSGSTPAQLTSCPWCGSEILPGRDVHVDREIGRTLIYCSDKYGRCDFSKSRSKDLGIPVLVVDDELYRRPPSMLIATVDKFALTAWRGQVRTLFGHASQECPRHGLLWPEADCTGNHQRKGNLLSTSVRQIKAIRPPDLIIQDEFHLISGPLGTMVGLYETAVDDLCSWTLNGKIIRPKIIASTATVRKASEQVRNVFLREVSVFPPHGLDVEDNFFSVQRPVEQKPGRRYIGICSPGSSRPAVLIRVYVAMLTAAQSLFDHFGQVADPYMTVVGYFNSLRELGGMRRLAEDDVQTRSYRVQMSNVARPGLKQRAVRNVDELTSRVSNKDIPSKLDRLEIKFKKSPEKKEKPVDIVLATNMLSVGVDVNRLGLMVVNGQPKSTAEYIQATSRVGRSFPGLVCTVLTWSRPRDLSHYETFEHYHSTFYKHVEAQSVTPFAPRALDRGLTGAMVSWLRMYSESLNPNSGAEALDSTTKYEVEKVRHAFSDRAWKVKGKSAKDNTISMISDRIDRWVKESTRPGRHLGYETRHGQGDVAALLKKPGVLAWDEFTVPMSMREVEPGVQLVMDTMSLSELPQWKAQEKNTKREGSTK